MGLRVIARFVVEGVLTGPGLSARAGQFRSAREFLFRPGRAGYLWKIRWAWLAQRLYQESSWYGRKWMPQGMRWSFASRTSPPWLSMIRGAALFEGPLLEWSPVV